MSHKQHIDPPTNVSSEIKNQKHSSSINDSDFEHNQLLLSKSQKKPCHVIFKAHAKSLIKTEDEDSSSSVDLEKEVVSKNNMKIKIVDDGFEEE